MVHHAVAVAQYDILEEALSDGVLDQVGETDAHVVRQAQKELSKAEENMEDFRSVFKERRAQYVKREQEAAATAMPKRHAGKHAKVEVPEPAFKEKRFPTAYTGFTDETTEAELCAFLPPGYRAYRDAFNARWQVSLGASSKHHLSRSWGKYGFVAAARLVCAAAWGHLEAQGNPKCPISRLMPGDAQLAQAASSGSGAASSNTAPAPGDARSAATSRGSA